MEVAPRYKLLYTTFTVVTAYTTYTAYSAPTAQTACTLSEQLYSKRANMPIHI